MALPVGARLGPYEVLSSLGAGGMGEVYRARDTRLDRTVAIKVLPQTLAGDPEFRERFDREARAISQLTDPHICTLYDVGEQSGTAFLVMEYLQGQTLAERLEQGALPLGQALTIAIEIARALDAAHRAGITHRDLKPANVMLTSTGAKLLDFGLARSGVPPVAAAAVSTLPTTPPLTRHGAILGTFQYMSPEQLEGAAADPRSDVFAFGCVLYEMLSGGKAFEGKTQASVIAAVLEREPPAIASVQPGVPKLVEAIVARCLAKKPDDRWQSVADLGSALRWAVAGTPLDGSGVKTGETPAARPRRLALAVTALAAIAIGAAAVGWRLVGARAPAMTSARFEILPPPDAIWTPSPVAGAAQIVISPDAQRIAFVAARKGANSQLWVRPLNRVEATPLLGTDGASFPFWSPDSRSLGFFAGGKLKTVDTSGGEPQALCDISNGRGGSWGPDGVILFAGASNSVISRIAASGGPVT